MALALLIVASPAVADEASASANDEDLVYYYNDSDGYCDQNDRWMTTTGPNLIGRPYFSLMIDQDCSRL